MNAGFNWNKGPMGYNLLHQNSSLIVDPSPNQKEDEVAKAESFRFVQLTTEPVGDAATPAAADSPAAVEIPKNW